MLPSDRSTTAWSAGQVSVAPDDNAKPPKHCQVAGCSNELPISTTYHQRYRICPEHVTYESMEIDGQIVRFCQQCGRFQPLANFDGIKKTCRRKLLKHNAQRKRARARGGAATKTRQNRHFLSPSNPSHQQPAVPRISESDHILPSLATSTPPAMSSDVSGLSSRSAPLGTSTRIPPDSSALEDPLVDIDVDELLRQFESDLPQPDCELDSSAAPVPTINYPSSMVEGSTAALPELILPAEREWAAEQPFPLLLRPFSNDVYINPSAPSTAGVAAMLSGSSHCQEQLHGVGSRTRPQATHQQLIAASNALYGISPQELPGDIYRSLLECLQSPLL